ncbi:hypothetical protein CICLE_v10029645mg [Citrus x clementina]|uniref:Uncharacterized protein n=1 Tax=Citrus clementina TaxID=85681 RepID=V4SJV3_CITCL|nr:hypothetical protein CICLE_v10029645mg [Citrus x clementina]
MGARNSFFHSYSEFGECFILRIQSIVAKIYVLLSFNFLSSHFQNLFSYLLCIKCMLSLYTVYLVLVIFVDIYHLRYEAWSEVRFLQNILKRVTYIVGWVIR